jgi:hypothetical protein
MKVQDKEISGLPQRELSCATAVQHNSVAMHDDIVRAVFLSTVHRSAAMPVVKNIHENKRRAKKTVRG